MPATLHHLKITLRDVDPKVVRELLVPSDLRLDRLHAVLQVAMGWKFEHLHEFIVGGLRDGERFGPKRSAGPFADFGPPVGDERRYTLENLAADKGSRFIYWYDFGDDWHHDVLVRAVEATDAPPPYPLCLEAKYACPPEDCGGPWGYANLLEALRDPRHPDHAEILDWLGGGFDPTHCDRGAIQAALEDLAVAWTGRSRKQARPRQGR